MMTRKRLWGTVMVVVESLRKTRLYLLLIGLEVMERDERQWKRANQRWCMNRRYCKNTAEKAQAKWPFQKKEEEATQELEQGHNRFQLFDYYYFIFFKYQIKMFFFSFLQASNKPSH